MKTNVISAYLEQLSLTPLEIKIYLALLEEGSMNAATLIKKLRVHRTSVYPPLESLFAKGLISKEASGKQVLFTITNPDQSLRALLDETAKQKKQELTDMEAHFPDFIKQLPNTASKTSMQTEAETKFYKGAAGVRKIYEEVLQAKEIRSYVNVEEVLTTFPENAQLFDDAFKRNPNIKMFEICGDSPKARQRLKNAKENHLYKILPKDMKLYSHDVVLYDGKIAIIHLQAKVSGIILINTDLYNNFKLLFDFVWKMLPESEKTYGGV